MNSWLRAEYPFWVIFLSSWPSAAYRLDRVRLVKRIKEQGTRRAQPSFADVDPGFSLTSKAPAFAQALFLDAWATTPRPDFLSKLSWDETSVKTFPGFMSCVATSVHWLRVNMAEYL